MASYLVHRTTKAETHRWPKRPGVGIPVRGCIGGLLDPPRRPALPRLGDDFTVIRYVANDGYAAIADLEEVILVDRRGFCCQP